MFLTKLELFEDTGADSPVVLDKIFLGKVKERRTDPLENVFP